MFNIAEQTASDFIFHANICERNSGDVHLTNLNTGHKRKRRSTQYHIVENDFARTVTSKWKQNWTSCAMLEIKNKKNVDVN